MTYLDNAAIRRHMYEAYTVRATERRARQPPVAPPHSGTAPRKGAPAGFPRLRRPGARGPHGAQRATARWRSWKISRKRPSAASARRIANCSNSAALSKARTRRSSRRGTSATTPRSSAPRSTISMKKRCGPYFPLDNVVAGLFDLVNRLYGIRVTRGTGVPVWDPAGALLQHARRERRVPRRLLRRLVSARKQARRRLDGLAHHRRSRARQLPSASRPDLRQSDAAGRRPARVADAPRGGDDLP